LLNSNSILNSETNSVLNSETNSVLNSETNQQFNQWLAGVIDGDGCFLVSKAGYCSLEITMHINDEPLLLRIKQKLGGSVKPRAGLNAVRYRLHNNAGMVGVVNRVNGYIRNSVRLPQLERVCNQLKIDFIPPYKLDYNSTWLAGFFDADGTITFSLKNYGTNGKKHPQLSISVSNKKSLDLQMFVDRFGVIFTLIVVIMVISGISQVKKILIFSWIMLRQPLIFVVSNYIVYYLLKSIIILSLCAHLLLMPHLVWLRVGIALCYDGISTIKSNKFKNYI